MGGLALNYKRVDQSFQMVGYLLLGLSMVPAAGDFAALKFAPISWGAELLRGVLVRGQTLTDIPAADLVFLVLNAVTYLVVGTLFFWVMEHRARKLGTIGQY
jgi:ABC-2 type transport system permease protein